MLSEQSPLDASKPVRRVVLGGCSTALTTREDAIRKVGERLDRTGRPLGVVSVNLDHVHHFGEQGRWASALAADAADDIEWLNLIDGAPIVSQARRITGEDWPVLSGSNLIDDLIAEAERRGARVGFLGGTPETHNLLRVRLAQTRPGLQISGFWAPTRDDLADHNANQRLAALIRESGTDLLAVCLGKPRQELWIAENGFASGAAVFLAFGAAVDFLAARVSRAPAWVSSHGMEWAFRLALEPRRLSRRYLIEGPPAYARVRRSGPSVIIPAPRRPVPRRDLTGALTVIIVTYQSADTIGPLLANLASQQVGVPLRIVVKDNGSSDETRRIALQHLDVELVPDNDNLGYAGGINAALAHVAARPHGESGHYLVLNPDLRLEDDAIDSMLARLTQRGVGAVVPRISDGRGELATSIRRAPSPARMLADAVLGARRAGRWSETDHDPESYQHPHPVDWATGAAVLVHSDALAKVGAWDERYFLYSEETDFLHRVRSAGWQVWFEPAARVQHWGQGSGTSPALSALMAVNRVRYLETHHGPWASAAARTAAVVHSALRIRQANQKTVLRHLLQRNRWESLPKARRTTSVNATGSVIVPAHDEAGVIRRTLQPLVQLAETGRISVVVAANGCSDETVKIAREFPALMVLDLPTPSKTAALNAADAASDLWPRLYLDADIAVTPRAVRDTLAALGREGGPLAARPPFVYDSTGATFPVRAYYRARRRLPSTTHALWGAGAYAVSQDGRSRFGVFPPVLADDLFVDSQFAPHEKAIVDTDPVVVRTPRDSRGLLAILRRTSRGNAELHDSKDRERSTGRTALELVLSVRGPGSGIDAVVYTSFVLCGRIAGRGRGPAWDRDASSRTSPEH